MAVDDRVSLGDPELDAGAARVTVFAGQNMFTPSKDLRDEASSAAIADDRPYAGWLYGGVALHVPFASGIGLNVEVAAGMVGPKSYAAEMQSGWHDLFGWKPFLGWQHQLPSEPTAQLLPAARGRADYDVLWDYGFSLFSPYTLGTVNVQARLGRNLPHDFGPPRIRPGISGADPFAAGEGGHDYGFAGVGLQAVVYNLFLDGTFFHHSPRVSKRAAVAEAQVGIVGTLDALTFGAVPLQRVRLALTAVWRSRECDGPWGKVETFWSFSLSALCRPEPRWVCV